VLIYYIALSLRFDLTTLAPNQAR